MLPGCSNKEETAEHRSLEGVIERIDVDESEVTLRYYSAKHKAETTITGKATAETEVFINGVLSSLEQLRVGERVAVIGWVRGHGNDREVVAVKVNVERADTIRRPPNGSAAGGDQAAGSGGTPPPSRDGR
jgi:hypothetical protein